MNVARTAASLTGAFQAALLTWVDETLAGAGISSTAASCGYGPLDGAPAVVPERVSADRIQESGADFNLAGVWGKAGAGSAPGSVPGPWSELGVAIRLRLETLVRQVMDVPAEAPVPQPRLLPLAALPAPLQAWYQAQPPRLPATPDWPAEPWLVDEGEARVRLPLLFWSNGFRLALQYSVHAPADRPEIAAPALAAVAAAMRSDRGVDLQVPRFRPAEGLAELVEALGSVPGASGLDLQALHAAAVGEPGRRVTLTPGPEGRGRCVLLSADLRVGLGPQLLPGSAATRRMAPPGRSPHPLGRAGS